MATKKRVAPEWMAPVLQFQQRFERELTEIKCQARECKTQADKFMKKTRADYQFVADRCEKVATGCERVIAEMRKALQDMPLDATQPPTPPPAKKATPTRKAKV